MSLIDVFLILSVFTIVIAIMFTLRAHSRARWTRLLIGIIAADVLVTVPLACWEIAEYGPAIGVSALGSAIAFFGNLIYDVATMMLFESHLDAFVNLVQNSSTACPCGGQIYLTLVQLLYVATIALIAYNAYALITNRFAIVRIERMTARAFRNGIPVYLFNCLDERTLVFLRDLFSHEAASGTDKRLCIVAGMSKENREGLSSVIEEFDGSPVMFAEASAVDLFNRFERHRRWNPTAIEKSRSFSAFFFADDETSNLSEALEFTQAIAKAVPLEEVPASADDIVKYEKNEEGELSTLTRADDLADAMLADGYHDGSIVKKCYASRKRFFEGRPRYHVYCACRGKNAELLFDSIPDTAGIDIRMVDEGREVIYDLFRQHPLYEAFSTTEDEKVAADNGARRELAVVIVGCGHYGLEVLRASAWLGQIRDVRLSVHAIDAMPHDEFFEIVASRFPGFLETNLMSLYYHSARIGETGFFKALESVRAGGALALRRKEEGEALLQAPPVTKETGLYCIVCSGDDERNIGAALAMRRFFCGSCLDEFLDPRILVDVYDQRLHSMVENIIAGDPSGGKGFNIVPFGGIAHIFTERHLVESDLESIAFNVNAAYEGKLSPEVLAKVAASEYKDLDGIKHHGSIDELRQMLFLKYSAWQMNRLSSKTCGLGMYSNVWTMGLELAAEAERSDKSIAEGERHLKEESPLQRCIDAYSKRPVENDSNVENGSKWAPDIEALARVEHDRWTMFYYGEGWTHETAEESKNYKEIAPYSSGRHDSHLLMRHPYLCDFDQLVNTAKAIGKKGSDPREYDVMIIEQSARILSDVGTFTGKVFHVQEFSAKP